MEIKRVDPYLLRWSADGALALATESAGLQLLYIESGELLAGRLRWKRVPLSFQTGRIVDMQWSPTLMGAGAGCLLACVYESGDVTVASVANEKATVIREFSGVYSAACWLGKLLILGDSHGNLKGFDNDAELWETKAPQGGRIVALTAQTNRIGAVTLDQQCWIVEDGHWTAVAQPGKNYVDSIAWDKNRLAILHYGTLTLSDGLHPPQQLSLGSHRPGHILVHSAGVSVVHNNGQISGSDASGAPRIQGDVAGVSMHPTLPMAVIAVTGAALEDWKYPILSWESVNVAVFPLSSEPRTPRRVDAAASASWLFSLIKDIRDVSPPPPLRIEGDVSFDGLQLALKSLFRSEWFDYQRFQWWKHETERTNIEAGMKTAIASVLRQVDAITQLDKLIVSLYLGEPHKTIMMLGDSISDEFEPSSITATSSEITSKSGRPWRLCSLTLLPILTLDTRISSDGCYVSHEKPPILSGAVGSNPVAEALIGAADFCIFTGSNWESSI